MNAPQRKAGLMRWATYASVATAFGLILLKIVAWQITDSVALLSSLVDSLLDAAASIMTLLAVRQSLVPADANHRFGHGKVESLAALAQAGLVTGSALFLTAESVGRLVTPQAPDHGIWGISVMLVWVVAICLIYNFITAKTAFGRYFYAVGGNEKATQLSGINTNKIYFIAYANMGLLAGLCGLLNAARVGSVNGNTGTSFEMDAIGACFIGGASAYGGSGTIGGVVIGALLLGVINMGMSIMGIGDSWQYVVKGGVLLLAVIFDVVTSRKSGKG